MTRLTLCLLAVVFTGCATTDTTPVKLRASIKSLPSGSVVEYRAIELEEDQTVARRVPWEYLGRTPYQGEIELPQDFLSGPRNRLELRLSCPGYHSQVRELGQLEIDVSSGIALDETLRQVGR